MSKLKDIAQQYKKNSKRLPKQNVTEKKAIQKDPFSMFVGCLTEAVEQEQKKQIEAKRLQKLEEEKLLTQKQKEKQSTEKHLNNIFANIAQALNQAKAQPLLTEASELSSVNPNVEQEKNVQSEPMEDSALPSEEETSEEKTAEKDSLTNPYLKELSKTLNTKPLSKEAEEENKLKTLVSSQLTAEINKIRELFPNFGMSGSGGGTNAVQYAEGGTMRGDLNVTGKYLSGGVDLVDIFGGFGGGPSGPSDRLVSGSQSVKLSSNGELVFNVTNNNITITTPLGYKWTFDNNGTLLGPSQTLKVNGLSTEGAILSGGIDLSDIFLQKDVVDAGYYT